MIKKWILLILTISTFFNPVLTYADDLDPLEHGSITITYAQNEEVFEGLEIEIYRIAEVNYSGVYSLRKPYSEYPVNIDGITSQKQWKELTSTLISYIIADHVIPDYVDETNAQGIVTFDMLETGLYLVKGISAQNDEGTFLFEDFMIYMPTPMNNGTYNYNVTAKPKLASYSLYTEYKVIKLWQDNGRENERPETVEIEIYQDDSFVETKRLSKDNNWTYSWKADDSASRWSVVEKMGTVNYDVKITLDGNTFIITNRLEQQPEIPPNTGDSLVLWPYITGMIISGFILIMLGILIKRK